MMHFVKSLLITSILVLFLASCNRHQALQNPFDGTQIDLPFHTESCSTEYPVFQDRQTVQKDIISSLNGKGITLQSNYLYQEDSVSFMVDVYDPSQRIGYIWINENILDFDAFDYWHFYEKAPMFDTYKTPIELAEALLDSDYASDSLKRRIKQTLQIKGPILQAQALEGVREQHIHEGVYLVAQTRYMQECMQFPNIADSVHRKKLIEICLLKQRIAKYVNSWYAEKPFREADYPKALKMSTKDSLQNLLMEIATDFHRQKFSLEESSYLLQKQNKGEIFIAQINHFDDRYNLPYNHLKEHERKAKLERKPYDWGEQYLQKIEQRRLKKKRKVLIRDIKQYVKWSKRQKN